MSAALRAFRAAEPTADQRALDNVTELSTRIGRQLTALVRIVELAREYCNCGERYRVGVRRHAVTCIYERAVIILEQAQGATH